MRRRRGIASVAAAVVAAVIWPVAAEAQTASTSAAPSEASASVGLALFQGAYIDLTANWGAARVCIIAGQLPVTECFASAADASVRVGEMSPTCRSPLRLFQHHWYEGRELWFFDRGYWQNLTDYGFNDELSSFIVGSCDVYLAEHIWGGGAWFPWYSGRWTARSELNWDWNDRISSVFIT